MCLIRLATPADVPAILELVRLLATYEREPDAVKATEADLLRDGFGEHPHFECLIAEAPDEGGLLRPLGFALYFTSYSTWRGRPGLHLEDLFVLPQVRGRGIAKALLARVAARAIEQDYGWLGWHVLEWNQSAIGFYDRLGSRLLSEWRIMRLSDDALLRLAAGLSEEQPS
jgi:GNAT superfamily N-acetyltransferase